MNCEDIKELVSLYIDNEMDRNQKEEFEEHIKEYSSNKELQKQFDCEFINDYTDEAKKRLINIIKERLKSHEDNYNSNIVNI